MDVVLVVAAAAAPSIASAALAPAFVGKVNVDTAYLTGAPGATDIAFAGDGRAVVTQKNGQIRVRRVDGTVASIAYPFGGALDTGSEKGLLGVVADPNVAQNQAFYFYVSNGPLNDKHRVYRAVLTVANSLVVDATPVIAASRGLGPGLEGPANHDGGGMSIHAGQLYVAVGDTGSNASPPVNKYGSCLNKGNGKVLRVNLDGTIPTDNPLVGLASVSACDTPTGPWTTAAPDRRIFAWGFRNPWRLWVDPQTGLMWVGDVGETTQEEISVGAGDRHHGYPFVEGNQLWGDVQGMNCSTLTPSRACTAPVFTYPRSQGQAVTGGLIAQGCGWTGVFGGAHYVFGDSSSGWLRVVAVNAGRTGVLPGPAMDFATYGGAPVSIRMGPDAALYVVFNSLGAVYRFSPTAATGPDCVPPTAVPGNSPWSTALLVLLVALIGIGSGRAVRQRRNHAA